jgi:flap endonuclease-1
MGVDLGSTVPRKEINFDYLKNKSVGVDAFNAIYQFLSSIRGYDGSNLMDKQGRITSHLQGIFSRNLNLMGKGIKLVYVFDGKAPALKLTEQMARRDRKIGAEQKYKDALDEEDLDAMYKYSKQFVRLDSDMIEESKELVAALGIPVVQAASEAEGQVAYMAKKKLLDFSASQDYDSLLFGAPRLVRNLTLSQKRKVAGGKTVYTFLELLELNEILDYLKLNQDQLIALGILSGTDFNVGGVKGIGPKKALKLVTGRTTVDKLDEMFNELKVEFDWKVIYDIFTNLPVEKNIKLKWNPINEDKIREILVEKHDFNLERINALLSKYKDENKNSNQKGLGDFF